MQLRGLMEDLWKLQHRWGSWVVIWLQIYCRCWDVLGCCSPVSILVPLMLWIAVLCQRFSISRSFPLVPHLPKSPCATPAVLPCLWTGVNGSLHVFSDSLKAPNLQTPLQFRSVSLPWWSSFFGNTLPIVAWAEVGKLQVMGPPKLAPERVHQVQVWDGDEEWQEVCLCFMDVI